MDLGEAKCGHEQRGRINGQETRLLVDQIRSIDTDYIIGDPLHYLEHDELTEVEHAVARHLGL